MTYLIYFKGKRTDYVTFKQGTTREQVLMYRKYLAAIAEGMDVSVDFENQMFEIW